MRPGQFQLEVFRFSSGNRRFAAERVQIDRLAGDGFVRADPGKRDLQQLVGRRRTPGDRRPETRNQTARDFERLRGDLKIGQYFVQSADLRGKGRGSRCYGFGFCVENYCTPVIWVARPAAAFTSVARSAANWVESGTPPLTAAL